MDRKKLVWVGATVGSFIGGYIPMLWDSGSIISMSGIIFGGIGGILGIYIAWKISE